MPNAVFWKAQRVLLTGHTGFKGSWAARWLSRLGAVQTGFALPPETSPSLHSKLGPIHGLTSVLGDIRDTVALRKAVEQCNPTIAIHMAAQPLVRRSYREPAQTYEINVQGTLNVLEALRGARNLRAVLVITTDKVYRNDDSGIPFKEDSPLGGHDPYSSSKAACEEVVSCYRQSFYDASGVALATARAGNVVGGGDWSEDRLVPDIWRAMMRHESVQLRHPESVRPWQHVLDPVSGYLDYVEAMASDRWPLLPRALNFAPAADDAMTVREVTEKLAGVIGMERPWELAEGQHPVESKLLTLDASLASHTIGWRPQLTGRQAIEWTADWIKATRSGDSELAAVDSQIDQYEALLAMAAKRRAM